MQDIRMFLRDGKLFVYDRAVTRRGGRTPVVILEKENGVYNMKKEYLEGSFIRNTDLLEQEIYRKSKTGTGVVMTSDKDVSSEMKEFLNINADQIDIALSVVEGSECRVDKIMKEVLSLDPKERAELLVAILDIM